MKKVKLFVLMLLAGTTLFITSCSKDKDTTLVINFKGGAAYISQDKTVAPNATFTVGIIATKSPDGPKLAHFTVTRNFSVGPDLQTPVDSVISDDITWERSFNARLTDGTEKWTFKITDKDGVTAEVSFTLTTHTAVTYGQINTWSAKLLGAQNAAAGSFFASSSGNIYTQADAAANAATIDVSYGVITPGNESFISPSERATYGFTPYTGATITYFDASSITPAVFDVLVNDSLIKDITTPATKVVSNIALNGVYKFVNAAGKKGLIKVTALTAGAAGSVTISVKVQKP
jgi:hypothetical protein